MNFTPRLLGSVAAALFAVSCGWADSAPSTRTDDDATFSDWFPIQQSSTMPEVFEIDVGRTFAPERVREVRFWVDTAGLYRNDRACDDGDAAACVDAITFEEIRRQEVFTGQKKVPNTTAFEVADPGEVFVFREGDNGDDFNRMKSSILDGKFYFRVLASSPGEFSLRRVHVTVHFRPARKR
jgi:hypothetical protein